MLNASLAVLDAATRMVTQGLRVTFAGVFGEAFTAGAVQATLRSRQRGWQPAR